MAEEFDALVVGGGLTGATAALELGYKGFRTAFVAPRIAEPDGRTTALMKQQVTMLERLGVWERISDRAAPLATMRIIDGTRRLFRAPTVAFHAGEIDEPAFAHNIANAALIEAMNDAVGENESVTRFESMASEARSERDGVVVSLADGTSLRGGLGIAADGRRSVLRRAVGIHTHTRSYPQAALVTVFSHRLPHDNVSNEFHTEDGPFTQVPLPGKRSSLVWVMRPRDAETLINLGTDNLARRIEERMQSMLGRVSIEAEPQRFPLSGLVAHRYGARRIVLVGEAAHVFPPIGAQGLNLALRDVLTLSRIIDQKGNRGDLSGVPSVYDRARRVDILSRTAAVDLLNRSLLGGLLPAQMLRGAGLAVLKEVTPLRNVLMREGMRPGDSLRAVGEDIAERFRNPLRRDRTN
ncbi:UbiH/UbiF family hydroxylase [Pararhizobium mangrovi]|uniref:UbiH/UbiF family hydroxylase n=1 Tax=Pararhizobium mangrovi TaxID=2590452 RepID=A0A506U1B7_9HYPH|nr:UbiH/UbiF family hydroxylase [Pararhizobium mangrovi]TPW26784.1 UbiH/UbiF family hydroxylase [Pararhizobium mangrovi]